MQAAWLYSVRGWRILPLLIAVATTLRMVVAFIIDQILVRRTGDHFFNLDERAYDRVAWAQAQSWHGVGAGVPLRDVYLLNSYTYVQAALYWLIGHQPFAMKLVNSALGGLVVGLVFLTAWRLFAPAAATASGVMAMLFPSTFLWSTTGLKDAMYLGSAMLMLWAMTEFLATARPTWLLLYFLGFAWMGGVRDYIQAMMAIVVTLSLSLQAKYFPHKWRVVVATTMISAFLLWLSGGSQWFGVTPAQLNRQRSCAAVNAESSYLGEDNAQLIKECAQASEMVEDGPFLPGTIQEIIAWFPTGAWHVLAAPFPWAAERTVERVAIPDVLCWYAAVALSLVTLWKTFRDEWRAYIHILGYIAVIGIILALTQGNLGTLERHRGMIIPAVLVFAGNGLLAISSPWLAQRSDLHTPVEIREPTP